MKRMHQSVFILLKSSNEACVIYFVYGIVGLNQSPFQGKSVHSAAIFATFPGSSNSINSKQTVFNNQNKGVHRAGRNSNVEHENI